MIRPKEGLKVRNPLNGLPLPADRNTAVYPTQFWLRRLKDGDVEESKAEEKKVSKKKKLDDQPPAKPSVAEKLGG